MFKKSGLGYLVGKILYVMLLSCMCDKGVVFADSAKSPDDCIGCHDATWRELKGKMYVHRPEREGDCRYCHVVASEGKTESAVSSKDQIKWIGWGVSPLKEHWIEIDYPSRGATLVVEARAGARLKVKDISLKPFDELEELPVGNIGPPIISNVRLLSVSKGVFVSAKIAWETDRPADSQVLYGFDKLDHASTLDRQAVTSHVALLTGVQPGKIYSYKVVSSDLIGNRVESEPKKVAVDVAELEQEHQFERVSSKDPEIEIRTYRHGTKSFVEVGADQAVSVRLGVMPKKYADGNSEKEPLVVRHLLLNTAEVTNTGICYSCHVEYRNTISHPVNVYPKRGMIIPPEYITLPDGRITCMSCHANHASNIEFRLIKDRKEELCRGCHRDIQ